MAFNPLHTFQRNRRFWMAAILMICMVSFVFCTGMKGDVADSLGRMFGGRGGSTVAVVAGHSVTSQQLNDLKVQRNVANEFMRHCNEIAFKKVSKFAFEFERNQDDKGNAQARQQQLFQLYNIRTTLYERSRRPRYFEIGVKFDDLLEFKLWQAIADKLEIRLDDEHSAALFRFEFFSREILDENDISRAQNEARRNFHNANDAFVRRAFTEEFRVRIAQEAVLGAQPFQFYTRRRQEGGFTMKFSNSEMTEQVRAPLTLAQLWEAYKTERAEFNVTLIPVHVDDFLKQIIDEPNDLQKADYFKAYRDKPADPGAEERGLQLPRPVKVEFVMADPTSKEYLGLARTVAQLKKTSPVQLGVVQSPLTAAASSLALAQKHKLDMQSQYDHVTRPTDKFDYRAAPYGLKDPAPPILTWLAKRHPEAAASMIASNFFTPANDFGALGSYAGFMAWGAVKHPQEVQASLKAEAERRAPPYAAIIGSGAVDPMAALGSYFALDHMFFDRETFQFAYIHPALPLETVQHEIEEMVAARTAEEWAQQNMQTLRAALEKDNGDEHKYKRIVAKLVPELNLTYGPAKKTAYVNRYSVNDTKELEPLKEAYLKYMHLINLFELRDTTPERLLKPGDFQKLFFDTNETFSATSPFVAMPWPPRAKPNTARIWKGADPRLIDAKQIRERDFMNFKQQLDQNDPLKALPELDLFKDAEKPILFWRTAERLPVRPNEYTEIERDLKKFKAEWIKIDQEAKKVEEVTGRLTELRKKQSDMRKAKADKDDLAKIAAQVAVVSEELKTQEKLGGGAAQFLRAQQVELKEKEADLEEIKRLLAEGWKFERARNDKALPKAEEIARAFLKRADVGEGEQIKTEIGFATEEAAKLKRDFIVLPNLAPMYPEMLPDKTIDYFKPPLPKDKIPFARDDMMDQAVTLWDMKQPIKIDNKALDDLNKELFDRTRDKKKPQGEYVQILTNKARSVFYVAVVTVKPQADPIRFNVTMRGIYNALEDPGPMVRIFPRDRFAERVQQQDAKVFRANVIAYFKSEKSPVGEFSILKEDARKEFDDRPSND